MNEELAAKMNQIEYFFRKTFGIRTWPRYLGWKDK